MKVKISRNSLVLIILAAVLAGIFIFYLSAGKNKVKYTTKQVELGGLESTISATGNLNPIVSVDVGSQVSGKIIEILVDFNSQVKKGQLIARIEPFLFQTQYAQSLANLNSAQADLDGAGASYANAGAQVKQSDAEALRAAANLAGAESDIKKAQSQLKTDKKQKDSMLELWQKNLVAEIEKDNAVTKYEVTEASLEQSKYLYQAAGLSLKAAQLGQQAVRTLADKAQAQILSSQAKYAQAKAALENAKINLEHTDITSPVDGVVVARKVDVGQTVAASFQTPSLFTIAQDLSQMQVLANVDEADIGKIYLQQPAIYTVDAFPEEEFKGKVSQIRLAPVVVQNVVTYEVIIKTSNPELKLKPGMTATVSFQVDKKSEVLLLPNAALRFKPSVNLKEKKPKPEKEKGKALKEELDQVWVLDQDKQIHPVKIKVGITDGNVSQVVSGDLKEGDEVVTGEETSLSKRNVPPGFGGGRLH